MLHEKPHSHSRENAFSFLNGRAREGVTVFSRRSMLKASLAGLAGLTLPGLLQAQNEGTNRTRGFDFEYERKLSASSRVRASYAWQYATNDEGKWLVNSP